MNDRVAYGHFTLISDPKLQKLRLTFNFNSEDNKGLYYQYDFSGRSETINNNEPTHLERKRKSRSECTLSCFCKCTESVLLIYCFSNIDTCYCTATVDSTQAVISLIVLKTTPLKGCS